MRCLPLFGLLLLGGCATQALDHAASTPRSPREAYDALASACKKTGALAPNEYEVVCYPNATPDYLDCVIPEVRPRYSCDIRVHARAYPYYKPVLIGLVHITVEAGQVVASEVTKARPIRTRTPYVTAITG